MSFRNAVIVIPVYKPVLSQTEHFSLLRCIQMLGENPIYFVGPHSLEYDNYLSFGLQLKVERFPDRFFQSLESYSELLLSKEFYLRFAEFEYMLIHQLDAFVFSNQLSYWCQKGYDYIGAPWLNEAGCWTGVGNGGFSLRRTGSFLRVLQSGLNEDAGKYHEYLRGQVSVAGFLLRLPLVVGKYLGLCSNISAFKKKFIRSGCPEDMLWGLHAVRFDKSFTVAPVEEAFHFSIEAGLEHLIDLYRGNPPFGCHREWFVKMLLNYSDAEKKPESDYERMVWELATDAGLVRTIS